MKRYLQPEIQLSGIQDLFKWERNNYNVIELVKNTHKTLYREIFH